MKLHRRHNMTFSPIALMLILAVGCSSTKQSSHAEHTQPEPAIPYTHVWSADRGVDLFSRGAELVRGTYEAGRYTRYVGVDRSYPGYNRAVGAPVSWHNEDKSERLVWSEINDPANPGRWTFYNYITNFSASETQISADVCSYVIPSAAGKPDSPWVLDDSTQIQLTNTGKTPGPPGIPDGNQPGHATSGHWSPTWNIFGSWQVTRIKNYVNYANPDACMDWWIQQFPTFTRPPHGKFVTSPPDYQPPIHPVAVQYPEWIGPSEQR
ncbi:hypothetical protein [Nocardia spumae]|uniref:hypothetical protein n=1 Tax=Nocardia spumae TaxID=2887190 RepID=UPI001D157720|nr:hypothetical protein [Nocardia spumae]